MKLAFALAISLSFLVNAQTAAAGDEPGVKVKKSMALLQAKLNAFGQPKIEGKTDMDGKSVPSLYFGKVKINNSSEVVDAVRSTVGGTATVFVKDGNDFIRISTNVLKEDGTRAVGIPLAKNAAYEAISKGAAFYGPIDVLGKRFETGYEPIKAGGNVIGIFYVGYKK